MFLGVAPCNTKALSQSATIIKATMGTALFFLFFFQNREVPAGSLQLLSLATLPFAEWLDQRATLESE